MRKRYKILLALGILFFCVLAGMLGTWWYVATHPASVKPFLENTLSQALGGACSIETLTYDAGRLEFAAENVVMKLEQGQEHGTLHIARVRLDLDRVGPFGAKTLLVKQFLLENALLKATRNVELPVLTSNEEAGMVDWLISVFVFQDLAFEQVRIKDMNVDAWAGGRHVLLHKVQATLVDAWKLDACCSGEISASEQGMKVVFSDLKLETHNTPGTPKQKHYVLSVPAMQIQSTHANLEQANFELRLAHTPGEEILRVEGLEFGSSNVTIEQQEQRFQLKLAGEGTYNYKEQQLKEARLELSAGGAGEVECVNVQTLVRADISPAMDANFEDMRISMVPERLLPLLRDIFEDALPPMVAKAPVRLRGTAHAQQTDAEWNVDYDLLLMLENNHVAYKELDATLNGELEITGTNDVARVRTGSNLSVLAKQHKEPIRVDADVKLYRKEGNIKLERLLVRAPKSVDLNARGNISHNTSAVKVEGSFIPQAFYSFMPANTRALQVNGRVMLSATIHSRMQRDTQQWSGAGSLILPKNLFAYADKTGKANGELAGKIQFSGVVPEIELNASLRVSKCAVDMKNFKANSLSAACDVEGTYPEFTVRELSFDAPEMNVPMLALGKKSARVRKVRLRVPELTLDADQQSLRVPGARFDSSLLKNLTVQVMESKGKHEARIRGKNADLLRTLRTLGYIPRGWSMKAKDSFDITLRQHTKQKWNFNATFGARKVVFESPDGMFMGEGLAADLQTDGSVDLNKKLLTAKATMSAGKGEVLADSYYVNFGENKLRVKSTSTYDFGAAIQRKGTLTLDLNKILTMRIKSTQQARGGAPFTSLTVSIPKTALRPAFQHFIVEPFKGKASVLETLDPTGNISADVTFFGRNADWTAKGLVKWTDGEVALEDLGITAKGITFTHPLWLRTGSSASRPTSVRPVQGSLLVRAFTGPFFPEQPFKLMLEAGPNAIAVKNSTTLRVPGGEVEFGPIRADSISGGRARVSTSMKVKNIDVEPIFAKLLPQSVKGRVRGELSSIVYAKGNVVTKGKLEATAFDGRITVSDISAANLLSAAPMLRANINFKDLNLQKITKFTTFGEVQGIMDGYVRNLEIADKQPQRFDLLMETHRVKGVSQRVSATAVDSIAQIGGGQSPFMGLAGTFVSFMSDFPYSKIGIRAALNNDVFSVNGTVKENGTEYLIKRSGLFGVNVVQQSPENYISFNDMLTRIQRVGSNEQGPVIE